MNTLIIYISDIHFTGRKAENEGIVINAFIQDIKKQLNEIPHK
jgi:ser/thr phosphatase family protein